MSKQNINSFYNYNSYNNRYTVKSAVVDAALICLWIILGILSIPKAIGLIKPLPTGYVL